jgi:hypothetical protein
VRFGPDEQSVVVVVPPEADTVIRFAADELQRYLGVVTGISHDLATAEIDGRPSIRLGVADTNGSNGSNGTNGTNGTNDTNDTNDGYRLLVAADSASISGDTSRGVLYGVYDLLERLGCRWYYPAIDPDDPEVVPRAVTVDLRGVDVHESGGFAMRVLHPSSLIYQLNFPHAIAQVDWAAKARYNALAFLLAKRADDLPAGTQLPDLPDDVPTGMADYFRATDELVATGFVEAAKKRGLLLEGPLHCMINFLPNVLFDDHPEWFGMRRGERMIQHPLGPEFCWSNPDAVDHFAGNVVRWVQHAPWLDVFAFTPNDGGAPCECPNCAQHRPSDLYAGLANTIRAKLRAAGLDTPVELTGGYPPVADPPSPGVLHPEVRVHWAHWGRPSHHSYGADDYPMRDNLDAWLALPNPLTMVEYYPDGFACPPVHQPIASCLRADNAWLRERGVFGNFQLAHPQSQWWNYSLPAWLGITFYYADRDPLAFVDDYAEHYYGPAGTAMRDYFRLLDAEQWLTGWALGPRWSEPFWIDLAEVERARPLLDRLAVALTSATAGAAGQPPYDRRVARMRSLAELLLTIGAARAQTAPLILDVERVRRGELDGAAVRDRLRAAVDVEKNIIDPMVTRLLEQDAGLASTEMQAKLAGQAPLIEAVLEEIA